MLVRLSIFPLSLLLFTSASAQFGPEFQYFCEGPRSVDLADVDADGSLDLIIGSRQGLGVYLNTDGQGSLAQPFTVGTEETVACAGDLNGDGAPDIIGSRDQNGGIYIHFNNGQGSFDETVMLTGTLSADEMHCADLDADGDQDAFFILPGGQLAVSYNNNGAGDLSAPMVIATLTEMAFAKAVDIDGDEDIDVLFSSRVANQVQVCFNIDGELQAAEQLSVSGFGMAEDLDNDGHPDMIVANVPAGIVGWQRNDPENVVFDTPAFLDQAFNAPEYLSAADLDGDGDKDAIVTSSAAQEVAWYENTDGQGDFGPRQTVTFDMPATAISAGDIDNDGDEDLFIASASLDKVVRYTNLSNATGKIMGRVFNDINGDGLFNGNDHGLMNMRVEATDLGATYTNASGMYWFDAVPAGYSISKPMEDHWQFTTASAYDVEVPIQGVSQDNDFGLQAIGIFSELSPDLGSAPMRCGTDISYWATVTNTGNQTSDVELSIDLDDLSTYMTAGPAPDTVENGMATWIFPNVQPTHDRNVHIVVHLPGSDHVGETLNDVVQATALIDGVPASVDSKTYSPILVCALDPNDKQVVPVGEGPQHLTPMGATLYYEVRFQNTGNAPAQKVVILDTLAADLDLSSLRMLNSSHTFRALLQTDGVLRITFDDINLPDSGSDQLGSQGFVRLSIDHIEGLPEGTVLNNTADIYFDNNPAVITNTTLNTLTYGSLTAVEETAMDASGLSVFPNPAQGTATVRLSDEFTGRIDLQLFDMKGQLLHQLSRRSNTVLIERGDLPVGSYLLRAVDERGTERVTRMAFE
jgi:uncharacterized repeat protein (TIGR01451 family)